MCCAGSIGLAAKARRVGQARADQSFTCRAGATLMRKYLESLEEWHRDGWRVTA